MVKEHFQRHFSFNILGNSSFLNMTKSEREQNVCIGKHNRLLAAVLRLYFRGTPSSFFVKLQLFLG